MCSPESQILFQDKHLDDYHLYNRRSSFWSDVALDQVQLNAFSTQSTASLPLLCFDSVQLHHQHNEQTVYSDDD